MQTKQILKLHSISLAALAVFFVVACLIAHEDCERRYFERSVQWHLALARLADSTARSAAAGHSFTGDHFASSKDSLVSFYLRDKLSLLHAYLIMRRDRIADREAAGGRAAGGGGEPEPGSVSIDANPAVTGLDVMFVTYDGSGYITTDSSRFLLDLRNDAGVNVWDILRDLPGDGSERIMELSGDGTYYAMASSVAQQNVLVAVSSSRRIFNLALGGGHDDPQFISGFITQLLQLVGGEPGLHHALYGPQQEPAAPLAEGVEVDGEALQQALQDGQHSYILQRKFNAFAVTAYRLDSLEDTCLVLASGMESMNEHFVTTALKLMTVLLVIFVIYAAVTWYIMKNLTLDLRREIGELDMTVRDFERLNFTGSDDRGRAVGELTQLRARQHTSEATHLGTTLINILEKVLAHYDEFVQDNLRRALRRGGLNVYRAFKQDLLPTPETIPNSAYLDIAAYLDNATDTGGNFYVILKLDEDNIAIALGDVGAHARSGVQRMLFLCPLIEKHLLQGLSPAKVMLVLNREICGRYQGGADFALLVAILNEKTGNFIVANAGMPLPVLSTDHETSDLRDAVSQAPLGSDPECEYTQSKGILVQHDTLLLCSHGLEKTLDPQGQPYGREHLCAKLREGSGQAADQILLEIYRDLARFTARGELREDITILCLRQKSIRF